MWWNFLEEPWKQGKILSKNLKKQPVNGEKNLENLEIGKKYLADTLLYCSAFLLHFFLTFVYSKHFHSSLSDIIYDYNIVKVYLVHVRDK